MLELTHFILSISNIVNHWQSQKTILRDDTQEICDWDIYSKLEESGEVILDICHEQMQNGRTE